MGAWMIDHFRKLLRTVDPEQLTLEDRLALLKLVQACLDADKKQRGGAIVAPYPDPPISRRFRSAINSSSEYSDNGTRTLSTPASAAVM